MRNIKCANYERDNNEENNSKWIDFRLFKVITENYNSLKEEYKKNDPLLSEMEQHIFDAMEKGICQDAIVESVRQKLLDRSDIGIKKYNTTLESNNKDNYLNHLQQELMDGTLYIQKLMQQQIDITELVAKYPNNMELGEQIRKIYDKI